MTSQAVSAIVTRRYEDQDESQVLVLLKRALGESPQRPRSAALWRWKHIDNHFGRSIIHVALNERGEIVGARPLMRWRFTSRRGTFRGARPVDTSTDPDYQRRGIFSRLTKAALAEAKSDGVALLFNTPNSKSLPGYLKLGWRVSLQVRPMIRILNHRRFFTKAFGEVANRRSGNRRAAEMAYSLDALEPVSAILGDTRFAKLAAHDETLRGEESHTARDLGFLRWRYGEHPAIQYRAVPVSQGGELNACAIVRGNVRFGLRECVVADLLLGEHDFKLALRALDNLADAVDADYLIAYAPPGSVGAALFRKSGFRRIPAPRMPLVTHPLLETMGTGSASELDPRQWNLSLGDIEYF